MPIPINQKLYDIVKLEADMIYKKPSAYKSGYIIKRYKSLGGLFYDDKKEKKLKRWFNEEWININQLYGIDGYPTYRPTIRVNKKTPLIISEIDKKNLLNQILLKQIYRGDFNLPKFKIKNLKN